ncbi:MAG: hypothetical protein JOS17DRAFT_177349 [Linnemannia elongata]|nr:MAG: hypothetical protein JOS17DRAFT_177349 [Linnemannia elongata]
MDGLAFRQISPELGSPPSPTFLTLLGCAVLGFVNGCPSLDSYLSQSLFRTWSVNGRGFFKLNASLTGYNSLFLSLSLTHATTTRTTLSSTERLHQGITPYLYLNQLQACHHTLPPLLPRRIWPSVPLNLPSCSSTSPPSTNLNLSNWPPPNGPPPNSPRRRSRQKARTSPQSPIA